MSAPPRVPPDLSRLRDVRAVLARHGLSPDKGYGQNFLIDRNALQTMVETADPPAGATVLEVGPGLGVLTAALAARDVTLVALELDGRLVPALRETTDAWPNVDVRLQDAVTFDHATMPQGSILASNLPYNVATHVIADALASGRYARMAVLVQREVAERIVARPGDDGFGAFSLLVEHFAAARIVRDVPPGCFYPAPKVTSSIVRLDPRPNVHPDERTFGWIRLGFRHRRKTLRKNLVAAGVPSHVVDDTLANLGLDGRVRAEALSLATWYRVADALSDGGETPREDAARHHDGT